MEPINFFMERQNKILRHKDKFKRPLNKSDYYIYVEDKGKGGFYESLLENIYGKKFEVFDNLGGKKYVIERYYEMLNSKEITEKEIFLLDRDYEHIFKELNFESLNGRSFSELEKEENIKILKRTNIENYLLLIDFNNYEESYEKIIDVVRKVTNKKEVVIKSIFPIELYIKMICRMLNLSYLFMISLCFDGTFTKKGSHICFDTFSYTSYYNGHLNRLKIQFKQVKSEYSKLITGIETMDFNQFLEEFKSNFDKNLDLDMKQLISQLVNCIIERSKKSQYETINKLDENSVKNFLLIYQDERLKEEFKSILKI